MTTETRERSLWVAHPSPIALLPGVLLTAAFGALAYRYMPSLAQSLINASLGVLPWTQSGAENSLHALRAAAFLPCAFVLLQMALLRFTRYELTSQRIRICRGMLLRRHDEVALHRIRDYAVSRPIMGLFFGFGSIRIISRDPTVPVLMIQWIPQAKERSEEIRDHALAWKKEMGYREFDSGALS